MVHLLVHNLYYYTTFKFRMPLKMLKGIPRTSIILKNSSLCMWQECQMRHNMFSRFLFHRKKQAPHGIWKPAVYSFFYSLHHFKQSRSPVIRECRLSLEFSVIAHKEQGDGIGTHMRSGAVVLCGVDKTANLAPFLDSFHDIE